LPFGVDGIEGQRAFAGAAQAGNHRKCITGNFDTDVFKIVLARAMHGNTIEHSEELFLLSFSRFTDLRKPEANI
jgi:hypothetical protein